MIQVNCSSIFGVFKMFLGEGIGSEYNIYSEITCFVKRT